MSERFAYIHITGNVLDEAWVLMMFDLATCNTEQLVSQFSRFFSTKITGALSYTLGPNRADLVTPGVLLTITN